MPIYYKCARYANGKVKIVITDENDNIVQNPTKEQRKLAIFEPDWRGKPKMDHKNTVCCICGSKDTYIYKDKPIWYSHKCNKSNCTTYECTPCHKKIDSNTIGMYANTVKLDAACRNENLDPSSTTGRGFIGSQIVAKRYGVEDCNLKMDDFRFYIDLSKISEYGYSEVKTSSFSNTYRRWKLNTDRIQIYDTLFGLCMDGDFPWNDVKRVYAFSWEIVVNRGCWGITIVEDSSRGIPWYEKFRIDEKPFNDAYHNMKLKNCKILRKDSYD